MSHADAQHARIVGLEVTVDSMKARIREHDDERSAWRAAGQRLKAEFDLICAGKDEHIDRLTRDLAAMSDRATELARRVTELEQLLARTTEKLAGARGYAR